MWFLDPSSGTTATSSGTPATPSGMAVNGRRLYLPPLFHDPYILRKGHQQQREYENVKWARRNSSPSRPFYTLHKPQFGFRQTRLTLLDPWKGERRRREKEKKDCGQLWMSIISMFPHSLLPWPTHQKILSRTPM